MSDTLDHIFNVCRRIVNDRDAGKIFDHLSGEVDELDDELAKVVMGVSPGEDGVIGEAVDVMLCAADQIWMEDPTMTSAKLRGIIDRKLEKWERLYAGAAA